MNSEYEDTDYATDAPLPTPRGTPYDRTPMLSRHPSRGQSPSPYPLSSSPGPGRISPPLHRRLSASNPHHHHDGAFDESISILDPRRFTPTLHANLVAEILSLRRELESKCNLVDSLENELDAARADHEIATSSIASAQKEARDAKRQLARAERDDAVTEVAKERDDAVEALAEMRRQMERLTKSRRAAEEDLERMRKVHERDHEKFAEAKRGYERRAHVAEGRLKAVLDEIAAASAAAAAPNAMPPPPPPSSSSPSLPRPPPSSSSSTTIASSPPPPTPPPHPHRSRPAAAMAFHRQHQRIMSEDYIDFAHNNNSDTASIRSLSIHGRPTSLMMGDDEAERLGISLHHHGANSNGPSLADELNFDESQTEEDTGQDTEHDDDHDELDELDELDHRHNKAEPEPEPEPDAYPRTDADEYPQTDEAELDLPADLMTDVGSDDDDGDDEEEEEDEFDELPELADIGIQVIPDVDHEERAHVLQGLLDERDAELTRTYSALDQKSADLAALYVELDKANTLTADAEDRLESLRSQGAQMDKDYLEREAKFDERVDAFKAREMAKEHEFDVRSTDLKQRADLLDDTMKTLDDTKKTLDDRVAALDATRQRLDQRATALDDRENALDHRERAMAAKDAYIRELKSSMDKELSRPKPCPSPAPKAEPPRVKRTMVERATSPPPAPVYVSAKLQTIELPKAPPRPIYVSAHMQTVKLPPAPKPKTVATGVQTLRPPAPKPKSVTTTGVQTLPPPALKPKSVTTASMQTLPPPPPPRPKSMTAAAVQTLPPPAPRPKSVSVQTLPATQPIYLSTQSQTVAVVAAADAVDAVDAVNPADADAATPTTTTATTTTTTTTTATTTTAVGLPSPPNTPQLESASTPMTASSGAQTDPLKPVKPSIIRVPAIMVSPPEPTPPLPKPDMKNACVQTKPMRVRTHSMQTEEIRLDERLKKFAPHLLPSLLLAKDSKAAPESEPVPPTSPPPNPPRKSSKRTTARRSATAPTPAPTSDPDSHPKPAPPPISAIITADLGIDTTLYDSPKSAGEVATTPLRRTSRRDINVDLSPDNEMHSSGDDGFPDEGDSGSEYKTALSAPKPRGHRRASPSALGFIPGLADIYGGGDPPRRQQSSMRKNAMVTSGVNAHGGHANARARSPSLTSTRTTESGGTVTKIGPPFPVPTRHSSKRPGYLSDRDRASPSPTPMLKRNTSRPRPRRPLSIRKVRSATALPNPRDQDGRRRSPAPLSVSSNAPDSPGLPPPLPKDEISSPAFDRRGFGQSMTTPPQNHHSHHNHNHNHNHHRHQASNNTTTTTTTTATGQASVGSSVQQTSVVDAIAQTMVGEWMWKYVRRRRSFGVAESPQGDDVAGGQRHKRWVWLAPYERAVMWSSRQPTSGSALLGKSGRKRKRSILHPFGGGPEKNLSDVMDKVLTKKVLIQSVLDVKDDTPMPKGASQAIFNRSILILTPARALKFTAPSRERHYVWLTALSFLSHSADSNDGLLALPPPMPFEYEQVDRRQQQQHHHQQQQHRQQSPAPPPIPPSAPAKLNAFSATRDSVRLAKGKGKASSPVGTTNGFSSRNPSGSGLGAPRESLETLSAEPPSIPRFPGTSRRRSNSNMRRPQTSTTSHGYERSYERSLASYATSNAGSTNRDSFYGVGGIGLTSASSSIAHGVSGGNGMAGGWEAGPMGTVRMEAFVDRRPRYEFDEADEASSSRPSSYRLRRDRRSSRHENYWGRGGFYGDDDDDFFRADDPFRGF